MSRFRLLPVWIGVVAALLFAVGTTAPAQASTTRTVSGKVTCGYGGKVVGIWVQSSAGGSRWSNTLTRNADYPNIAKFTASITTGASSTTIRLDIGCGGTSSKWGSNNSTPGFTVSGSKSVTAKCWEKAGDRAQRCSLTASTCATSGGIGYRVSGSDLRMRFSGIPAFKNGPGGEIEVSKSYSGSVTRQVTAGAEAEVGAVLAKAKVSLSASLSTSNSTSATNTYRHTITPGKFGNAVYVSYGKRVSWRKVKVYGDCTGSSTLASGVINFPSSTEGWYYWESAS